LLSGDNGATEVSDCSPYYLSTIDKMNTFAVLDRGGKYRYTGGSLSTT
jgi:hypothetical protein